MERLKELKVALLLTAGIAGGAVMLKNQFTPQSLEQKVVENQSPEAPLNIKDPLVYNLVAKPAEKPYASFNYQREIPAILKHAQRLHVEPELLMAIRVSENGGPGREYGVLPQGKLLKRYVDDKGYSLEGHFHEYSGECEKQLAWAARSVHNKLEDFKKKPEGHTDFISYFASKWAPIGVKNDPTNLNKNWESNVRHYYEKFKHESEQR